jgi:hypothetical protein
LSERRTNRVFEPGRRWTEREERGLHIFVAELGKLPSPNDSELVEKTLARIADQDTWNDVLSTKLIELVDNIDGLQRDLRERMRRIESVTRSVSLLFDEATTDKSGRSML